jgi:O-acetyl-ADP-ribose deacetylase (regulator of RNase III)
MTSEAGSIRRVRVEVRRGDPLTFDGDGLVVPTISDATMAEGLAARVRAAGGRAIEDEARHSAPIAVGAAVVTGPGTLPVKRIIHVPVSEEAATKLLVENIRRATRAGLLAAKHFQMERLAIPGFGYGELGVPCDEAARAIIDEVRAFRGQWPNYVLLVDTWQEMVDAFLGEFGDH